MGRRLVGVAGALAIAAAVVVGTGGRAWADQTLGTGQVLRLSDNVPLTSPADGRLNGYGFASRVAGIGFVHTEALPTQTVTAAPGDQLAVIDLRISAYDEPYLDPGTLDGPFATFTVVAGSTRTPLPIDAGPSNVTPGTDVYAVAVPVGAPVYLQASRAGFTQTLDLRTGRRVGMSPDVLYRDPAQPWLETSVGTTQTLDATESPGGTGVAFDVTVANVYLTYFPPDPSLRPPVLDTGWLILDATTAALTPGGDPLPNLQAKPLPAAALHLVLAGGTQVPAAHVDQLGEQGLLGGIFYFSVPADLTKAQLVVEPGVNVAATDNASPVDLAFTQPATFDLSLPSEAPASPPLVAPGVVPAAAVDHPRFPWAEIAVLVALALIAGAVCIVSLRRWRDPGLAALPVVHTQAALMAGAGPPALSASPRGLGPGPPVIDASAEPAADAPAPPAGTRLVVSVLGPLVVEGLTRTVRRKPVTRLLVCLALNIDRAMPSDTLRYLLATGEDAEPSESTLYNYAHHLRQALPEGILPANNPGGYRLGPGVEVDWAIFEGLVARAAAEPAEMPRLVTTALSLVRGQPLAQMSWAGIEDRVNEMVATIERVAHDAATAALAARDARAADWAISRGLLASPGSPGLLEDRMVAAAAGSGYGVERAWADAQRILGPDAAWLEPAYRSLRGSSV